jgi:ubiquinone/menaquinone biosynthesis C-methylase UbiE
MNTVLAPNHHHNHPGFSGVRGLMMGLTFATGRNGVAGFAADLAGLADGDAVIDIGCGPGNAARYAAKHGAATVLGVDPAPVMLRLGRVLTRRRRVTYRAGTAESIPADDDSATVLWSLSAVHHWADLDKGLAEVRRVLRPGGRFVAVETSTMPDAKGHASHGWTDDQAVAFADFCRDAGFSDVSTHSGEYDNRQRVAVLAR